MAGATSAVGRGNTRRSDAKTPAQLFAYVFGAVLLLVGIIGFFVDSSFDTGTAVHGDKLLGIFEVNGIHNIVHIASGLFLLAVAPKRATAKGGVLAFALIYGLVTVIGLIDGEDVLGLIPVNAEDNILHIVLTLAALGAALAARADDRVAGRTAAATR